MRRESGSRNAHTFAGHASRSITPSPFRVIVSRQMGMDCHSGRASVIKGGRLTALPAKVEWKSKHVQRWLPSCHLARCGRDSSIFLCFRFSPSPKHTHTHPADRCPTPVLRSGSHFVGTNRSFKRSETSILGIPALISGDTLHSVDKFSNIDGNKNETTINEGNVI